MKITSVQTHIVGDDRNFLFVEIEADNGLTGIGEAGVTWQEPAVAGMIETLKPRLIGQNPCGPNTFGR